MALFIPMTEITVFILKNNMIANDIKILTYTQIILVIIFPSLNLLLIIMTYTLNKFILGMATFRFRNKLIRKVTKMDFVLMILLLFILILYSVSDSFENHYTLIYLLIWSSYVLLSCFYSVLDPPYLYGITTKFYRVSNIVVLSILVYILIVIYFLNILSTNHVLNIVILCSFSFKLGILLDHNIINNELYLFDLIPNCNILTIK